MNEIDAELEVFSETELSEVPFNQLIFGKYESTSELINGQKYFEKTNENLNHQYGIWWACGDRWCIGNYIIKGQCQCIAFNINPKKCLPKSYQDWNWFYLNGTTGIWLPAGKRLGIRDLQGII